MTRILQLLLELTKGFISLDLAGRQIWISVMDGNVEVLLEVASPDGPLLFSNLDEAITYVENIVKAILREERG